MAKERIGIMGGSFNPIHMRHVEMAKTARKEYKLDRVLFLPTGNPPHKKTGLEDAEHRFEMTRLAIFGMEDMEASRMELEREGVIYTVDTLGLMHKKYPGADFYYIIGEDTMKDLPNWRKPEKVFGLCSFIVCCRSTELPKELPVYKQLRKMGAKLHFLSLPPLDVSSTAIRKQLVDGQNPEELSPQVMEYIRIMGLYGVKQAISGGETMYDNLKKSLSEKRLVHSLLVAFTARKLAELSQANAEQAELAGLLHDCAKCMSLSEMQEVAREHRLLVDREVLQSENLLHAYAGAALAETRYGVEDYAVLAAIRCHTTGRIGMLPLDMALYLADKIEPSRRSYPVLEEVRRLAYGGRLVEAMRYSINSTVEYVKKNKNKLHGATLRTAQWLDRLHAEWQKKQQSDHQ